MKSEDEAIENADIQGWTGDSAVAGSSDSVLISVRVQVETKSLIRSEPDLRKCTMPPAPFLQSSPEWKLPPPIPPRKATVLDLPLVAYTQILGYLPPHSWLALRRVCKTTKGWITGSRLTPAELRKWENFRLSISGNGLYTFNTAAGMHLPITSFHLRNTNSDLDIYDTAGVKLFTDTYGKHIEDIIVDRLFMFQPPVEREFFESLAKLSNLKIQTLVTDVPWNRTTLEGERGWQRRLGNGIVTRSLSRLSIFNSQCKLNCNPPENITATLRLLSVTSIDAVTNSANIRASKQAGQDYILRMIRACSRLRYIHPPPVLRATQKSCVQLFCYGGLYGEAQEKYCPYWMQDLEIAVREHDWAPALPPSQSQSQRSFVLDMGAISSLKISGFSSDAISIHFMENYFQLLQEAYERGAQLQYVFPPIVQWIYTFRLQAGWPRDEIRTSLKFLDNVVSITGISPVLSSGYSKMNDLTYFYYECNLRHLTGKDFSYDLDWPNLRTIDLTLILERGFFSDKNISEWESIQEGLFDNRRRSSVKTLSIKFRTEPDIATKSYVLSFHKTAFEMKLIAANFKNVTSLTLAGWKMHTLNFGIFWRSMKNLEYVCIDSCKYLNNCGFRGGKIGRVSDTYAFLALTRLRVLVFKNLEEMTGITGELFIDVISKMPLKEFWIYSKQPVPEYQISAYVLASLRDGMFGRTIEKFPFDTWTSGALTDLEIELFKKQFRSFC